MPSVFSVPDDSGVQPEGGRFHLLIAPGLVKLGWTRPVRIEKSSERAATHTHWLSVAAEEAELRSVVADVGWQDGPGSRRMEGASREITHWSRKSRTNMCRSLAEYDYTPIVGRGRIPAMVTLTYPGDWEVVAPRGRDVKRHLENWRKRFEREWGRSCASSGSLSSSGAAPRTFTCGWHLPRLWAGPD